MLDPGHQIQRELIVRKTSRVPQALLKHILATMPKGRMADVVKQRHGLNEVFVEPQTSTDRSG